MYSKLPDHVKQLIVAPLSVYDLQRVAAVSRGTRQWLEENCDKSIMREGRKNRRLRIDLEKLAEYDDELKVS